MDLSDKVYYGLRKCYSNYLKLVWDFIRKIMTYEKKRDKSISPNDRTKMIIAI